METSTTKSAFTTKRMVEIALITAVICILAPFAIPIPVSPVPISLTNLVIYIAVFILSWNNALFSYIIYLLLGIAGLPVFSGFTGGLEKLAGPTGGYLIGFIFMTIIAGIGTNKFGGKKLPAVLGMVLGLAVAYIFGTAWLAYQMHISFMAGLSVGVLPYLAGDAVKIIIAMIVGPILRSRLSAIK